MYSKCNAVYYITYTYSVVIYIANGERSELALYIRRALSCQEQHGHVLLLIVMYSSNKINSSHVLY